MLRIRLWKHIRKAALKNCRMTMRIERILSVTWFGRLVGDNIIIYQPSASKFPVAFSWTHEDGIYPIAVFRAGWMIATYIPRACSFENGHDGSYLIQEYSTLIPRCLPVWWNYRTLCWFAKWVSGWRGNSIVYVQTKCRGTAHKFQVWPVMIARRAGF
jgi:hypothetical protein